MATAELHYLELNEIAHLIQTRKVSPVEVTQAQLARIAELDGKLRSYALVTADLALEQARRAEEQITRRQYKGALHGVPVGLKDLCYTLGITTAAGTTVHQGFKPTFDGTVVKRLYAAGAICLGKVQLTEGAFADHHPSVKPPVNPWHPEHWSGASSSGSGVAAAAGLCYGAIGSDTGGSIRFPCAANGVTGIKPTWGRVSRYGAFELAATLDHLGPMGRSATDCGIMLGAIAGADPDDPTASQKAVPDYLLGNDRDLRDLRVGVDERYNSEGVDTAMVRTVHDTARVLASLGAQMVSVQMPSVDDMVRDWGAACAVETAVAHEATFPARRVDYGPGLAGFIDSARGISAAALHKIGLRRHAFRGRLAALFRDIDLLLIPAQFIPSPTKAQMATLGQDPNALGALIRFTAPFDMSGSPTITLPSGFTARNTPIAVQLVSAHWGEDLLVRAGRAYQRETDWHRQHPKL